MTHPIILAARAAIKELTTEEAKVFFKATALEHSMLTMFYFLEAVYWTVEAGRLTRCFVDSFNPPPAPEAVKIAGLLCPAQDDSPITTAAVITNQQKLEQHIVKTLQGIYDHEFCTEIGSMDCDSAQPIVEQVDEPGEGVLLLPSGSPEPSDSDSVPTRQRKSRGATATSNGRQSSNKSDSQSRVSGTGDRVQGKRHKKNAVVQAGNSVDELSGV